MIAFARYRDRHLDPGNGPTTTSIVDFLGPNSIDDSSFFVEDINVPNLFRLYSSGQVGHRKEGAFVRRLLQRLHRVIRENRQRPAHPLDHVMPWFAQGRDKSVGQFHLRKRWHLFGRKKLKLRWTIEPSIDVYHSILDMHDSMTRATGGSYFRPNLKNLITTHPLGGCNMATSIGRGVVKHSGEAFNYDNLYVCDGSIIPAAIGSNPSKTIAALAERTAALIVSERR